MSDGSRWYFPVYEGLFAAEHCERMGPALWLYGWIIARAHVAQNSGLITYNHDTAAEDLGRSRATIRAWFAALQQYGYIHTRARHPYHLEVQVSKWRAVEEWWEARRTQGDGYMLSTLSAESAIESAIESDRILAPYLLSITLSHYQYPSDAIASERHSLADAFRDLLEHLKTASNKAAVLAQIYRLCFGEGDMPTFGYLGKAAKAVGGAGRLAELMWQATAKPPTGDVLAYLMAVAKRQGRANGKAKRQPVKAGLSETAKRTNRIALADYLEEDAADGEDAGIS